jgi:predicted phage baseplate assembly protein
LGINAAPITQGGVVSSERLPQGTGEPDQIIRLGHKPVIPDSLTLRITPAGQEAQIWTEIADLISASPEAPAPNFRLPPGANQASLQPNQVFQLDAEAGEIRFGDGAHGKRPPLGASILADYIYSDGAKGNVGSGSVNNGPALPGGFKVANPVPTWGGADSETQTEAEKHIPRYLQHRDRLVTINDFETITWRTPGADVGRVEVIPAYHPRLSLASGDAPGMVTLMLIPRNDADNPNAPRPDQNFLDAVCAHLNPRRLVTTELYLTGPSYVPVWISIGILVLPGISIAETRDQVKKTIQQFLSPLPPDRGQMPVDTAPQAFVSGPKGWPLGKPVVNLELAAVASRVPGVMAVKDVLIAKTDSAPPVNGRIAISGLELPCLAGISVVVGDPLSMAQLGNTSPADDLSGAGSGSIGSGTPGSGASLPIPAIPEECR